MRNNWSGLFCISYAISFVCCTPKEKTANKMLRVLENYENRVHLEKKHQTALLSSSNQYEIWSCVGNDMRSECGRLLRNLYPKTRLTMTSGELKQIQLIYKRIRDQYNKPLPLVRVTALVCRHSKPKYNRKFIYLIKSPDPKCAFFLNRLGKLSPTTFYIADEICEHKIYPKFWKLQLLVEETFAGERRISSQPEDVEKQEQYEREHWQDFHKNPVIYETWPELDHVDKKLYCHRLLQDFFPRTGIDLADVKAECEPVMLSYRRITNIYQQDYARRKVNALRCSKPRISNNPTSNGFTLVRAPKSNCVLKVNKRHSKSLVFHISRQLCDDEEVTQTHRIETGMDQVENDENSKGTEVYDDTFDQLSPIEIL